MRAIHYAHALHEALAEHPEHTEKLLKHFVETVVANSHTHLFPKIIKSYARIAAKDEKAGTIEVTSAVPLSEPEVLALLKKEPFSHAIHAAHKRVVRKTDPTITGGVVVRSGTVRIDASYKQMLRELYSNMIKN